MESRTNKIKQLNLLLILFLITTNSIAKDFNKCFKVASNQYKIPEKLLIAIAKIETQLDPYAININKNRTYDIGLMQINSSWLKKLNGVGITQADLLDGCKNIQVGAWILASNIKQYGFNSKAIGAYNSRNPFYQERYARKVLSNL